MREVMLILHFLGLTMGLGTGFAHAFLSSATAKMTPDEAVNFRLNSLVLGKMGNIGIILLIVSGGYLITPFWGSIASMPLLITKLSLVAILVVILILLNLSASRAKNGNAEVELKKMEKLGKMTLPLGIIIVILAAFIFH